LEFEGKVAVITGSASGIGRAVALALARLGSDIVLADIDTLRLEEVRQEIGRMGRRALAINCNVSKDSDVDNLAALSVSTMGKVDILINNAGVASRCLIEDLEIAEWKSILDINLLGPVRGVHAFLPHMLKRGSGYIVNTSSMAGLVAYEPQPFAARNIAYSTSKFGVVGFSQGLYGYLRPKGIMVSAFCPFWVATNLGSNTSYLPDTKRRADMKSEWEEMLKGLGAQTPDEVAQILINGMQENRFLILTHQGIKESLKNSGQDIDKFERYLQDMVKSWR